METEAFNPFPLLAVATAVLLLPFAVVTVTAFIKISIVLFLIRNALGIQQTPPNLVLYGIALVLTVYIIAPVMGATAAALNDPSLDLENVETWPDVARRASEPLRQYLERFSEPDQRAFFLETTAELWPEAARADVTDRDLTILIPAYVVSELTRAFEIGFLLYLPFIIVDLVITNILTAMGMLMVSPTLIALPFKLFLFVVIDGWSRLAHGLVLSYA